MSLPYKITSYNVKAFLYESLDNYIKNYKTRLKHFEYEIKKHESDFYDRELNFFEGCHSDIESFSATLEGIYFLDKEILLVLLKIVEIEGEQVVSSLIREKLNFLKKKLIDIEAEELNNLKKESPGELIIETSTKDEIKDQKTKDLDQIPVESSTIPLIAQNYRKPLLEILKLYFTEDQHGELTDLIKNQKKLSCKLSFKSVGNRLADAFKTLYENEIITQCNKKQLEHWISINFDYFHNDKRSSYTSKYLNDIISAQESKCKSPILRVSKSGDTSEKILVKS